MDTNTQAAQKIVTVAMCVLALAVARRKRADALGAGYVVTIDPDRSREAHSSSPGITAVVAPSSTVLDLVRDKLRAQNVAPADAGLLIRHTVIGRPWFDISVKESPHEIVMTVATIHPIRA